MDKRAKGTVITIIGIASLAALGAAIGAASHRHGRSPGQWLHQGQRRMSRVADWDALTGILERVVDALPRRESARVLHRVQSRLRNL